MALTYLIKARARREIVKAAAWWARTASLPAHRPIKPIYVKKFVDLVDGA